jgi:hypothetical protein
MLRHHRLGDFVDGTSDSGLTSSPPTIFSLLFRPDFITWHFSLPTTQILPGEWNTPPQSEEMCVLNEVVRERSIFPSHPYALCQERGWSDGNADRDKKTNTQDLDIGQLVKTCFFARISDVVPKEFRAVLASCV